MDPRGLGGRRRPVQVGAPSAAVLPRPRRPRRAHGRRPRPGVTPGQTIDCRCPPWPRALAPRQVANDIIPSDTLRRSSCKSNMTKSNTTLSLSGTARSGRCWPRCWVARATVSRRSSGIRRFIRCRGRCTSTTRSPGSSRTSACDPTRARPSSPTTPCTPGATPTARTSSSWTGPGWALPAGTRPTSSSSRCWSRSSTSWSAPSRPYPCSAAGRWSPSRTSQVSPSPWSSSRPTGSPAPDSGAP